jgi:pSer/pThr/pTyr-binding forkhead associated (FHA) protein
MTRSAAGAADVSGTVDERTRQAPFGAPHVFVLAIIDGESPESVHRLARAETILGRGEEAHLSIDDEKVSKTHCKIRVDGPVATVIDLGSRNGTSLNGRRIPPNVAQRLKHLDEVEVGTHRLLFLSGRFRDAAKAGKN